MLTSLWLPTQSQVILFHLFSLVSRSKEYPERSTQSSWFFSMQLAEWTLSNPSLCITEQFHSWTSCRCFRGGWRWDKSGEKMHGWGTEGEGGESRQRLGLEGKERGEAEEEKWGTERKGNKWFNSGYTHSLLHAYPTKTWHKYQGSMGPCHNNDQHNAITITSNNGRSVLMLAISGHTLQILYFMKWTQCRNLLLTLSLLRWSTAGEFNRLMKLPYPVFLSSREHQDYMNHINFSYISSSTHPYPSL